MGELADLSCEFGDPVSLRSYHSNATMNENMTYCMSTDASWC